MHQREGLGKPIVCSVKLARAPADQIRIRFTVQISKLAQCKLNLRGDACFDHDSVTQTSLNTFALRT